MEVELISSEIIKPSTPTPLHLRTYPLSFFDHVMYRNYVPAVFFYNPNLDDDNIVDTRKSRISKLKESLSRVLSRYYPFAGKFRDQLSIECNDDGVPFRVTEVRGKLSAILQDPDETLVRLMFPENLPRRVMNMDESIVVVQINCFPCGGMAVSVCMCHKVGDATTLLNFVNDWATMNREDGESMSLLPSFPLLDGGVSVFPYGNMSGNFPEMVFGKGNKTNAVCRRFVFPASKIKSLKAMVTSHNVQNPTRVEVVASWIYMRAVLALGLTFDTTSFRLVVNLRKRIVPQLPNKSVGNMLWFLYMFTPGANKRGKIELHDLVAQIKENFIEFCDLYPKKFGGNDKDLTFISKCLKQAPSPLVKPHGFDEIKNHNLFIYTSWCRFPVYEVDFGWGKPIWVTTCGWYVSNGIFLMDTRDGDGIEALVHMEEEDMVKFEHDVEFLQYATLNPTREKCYY